MVPKERFELSHPFEYYALNVARLPFRHFGDTYRIILAEAGAVNAKQSFDTHLESHESLLTLTQTCLRA